ncbi:hypothetical protein [Streptomyces regalis]|uniref:Uncharacterized protein n=1 Tax=Streptomyces regalis TaxID=68262 RepID=A0A101JH09_9ACTN|nr:hypothetical protein [Streptomyces regalis]KUL26656.1 hypothetical protein ADL12_32400 [Streptomyces regalis]
MATDPPIHPTETLTTPAGDQADIDTEMVPVIRELWRLGFTTTACCQDVGEATAGVRAQRDVPLGYGGDGFIAYHRGYALLKMPVADAQRLAALLAETAGFGDRIRRPWSVGSWRMNVPLEPRGPADEALLHFPRTQISLLIDALRQRIGEPD